jgi:hypothetical protein
MCRLRPLQDAGGFFVQPVKEFDHELVAGPGDSPAFFGEDSTRDLAQFYQEFPVGRIVFSVRLRLFKIDLRVMQPGPDFARKQKSPPDTDGSDRVQFIRIEQDFRLDRPGEIFPPEAMRFDAVDDLGDFFFVAQVSFQYPPGQVGTRPGVTDFPVGSVFLISPDVMKDGRELQNFKVRFFLPADAQTELANSFSVIPVMAAPGMAKVGLGFFFDLLEKDFTRTELFPFFSDFGHLSSAPLYNLAVSFPITEIARCFKFRLREHIPAGQDFLFGIDCGFVPARLFLPILTCFPERPQNFSSV